MINDPGELNEKVQLLAPTVTYGANGEPLNTWGDYGTRWCKVEQLGGDETVQVDIIMPVSRAKFTFRYDSNFTEDFRLVWNSQTWNVTNISFEGKTAFIILIAETNTSQTGDATSYGDYYLTNSLKLRRIDGAMVGATPTAAEVNTACGLTPITAGNGYAFFCTFRKPAPGPVDYSALFISNGTSWLFTVHTLLT